jgi:hypothetical protein
MGRASDVFIHNESKSVTEGSKLSVFLQAYVDNGGDHLEASRTAGYATSNGAKKLLRDNWQSVQDLVMQKIGGHVPFAIEGIVHLAGNAKSEQVRLKACQDLLSRAGLDSSIKIESRSEAVEDLESSDLEAELLTLISKAKLDVTTEVH